MVSGGDESLLHVLCCIGLGRQVVSPLCCFHFLFAGFRTVEYIGTSKAFSIWCHSLEKKFPMEKETTSSVGGTNTFITLFHDIYKKGECVRAMKAPHRNVEFGEEVEGGGEWI